MMHFGVPAEFTNRDRLRLEPIKDFIGYKSHNQPPGTFSDDSSLTFCLAKLHAMVMILTSWASALCSGVNMDTGLPVEKCLILV